jgi:hypothetical protein
MKIKLVKLNTGLKISQLNLRVNFVFNHLYLLSHNCLIVVNSRDMFDILPDTINSAQESQFENKEI